MCLFHVFLVPCFFRYISNYTAENTHSHTHATPPSPNRRWVQVSGDLFIFQHTQQICPVPIISLSTLTTLPTTKHWLTDWVTCSQACFYLCCVLKYIFIAHQILNGYSCRLNAKNETKLYTFFFFFLCIHKGTDCIDTASVLFFVSFSFFIQKSLPACPLFSELHSPRSHSSCLWKKQKETASTTDNESKTVLTFGLLNNTGYFFYSVESVMVTALTLILTWAPLSPRGKVRYPP